MWALTMSDLTQQVLCFFVLLFSMATIDPIKVVQIGIQMQELAGKQTIAPPDKSNFIPWVMMEFKEIDQPGGAVVKSVEGTEFTVQRSREGVRIAVQGDALFAEGASDISPRGRAILDEVCVLLRGTYNKVEVRGHTAANAEDSLAGDHWLLGYQRALAVLRVLTDGGVAEQRQRVSSVSRNDPVASNLLAEQRGRNRRVEIIVTEEIWDPNQP